MENEEFLELSQIWFRKIYRKKDIEGNGENFIEDGD